MIRNLLLLMCVLSGLMVTAQAKIPTTDSFVIRGAIKNPITITVKDLSELPAVSLNDISTINHMGQVKGNIKSVKGVLLREILKKVELNLGSPKEIYALYIESIATDGYKTVFSWNEVMNTPNGDNIYVITERDGQSLKNIDDRIATLMITTPGKGHIYIKGLAELLIQTVK